jgi:carotenoid cleavage dioxygenase-like enzyme
VPQQFPTVLIATARERWDVTDTASPGFRTVDTEYRNHAPRIEGSVPDWLSGTLVRNGPGRFDVGGERVNHWFDGLAMLRRYAFADGAVRYTNRFLRTDAYADAMAGRTSGEFATGSGGWRTLRSWLRALGPPDPTDNASVHVARVGDEYVALTEAPRRVAFDPVTLDTRGPFRFDDDLPEHVATAHLVADPHRGELVGYATELGRDPQYHVYRVPDGETRRRLVGSVPARGPGYVHDCSVTADHVVLVEPPLEVSVWRALAPWTEGFLDLLSWHPEAGTRIVVLDRDSGDVRQECTVEPVFTFHHVNAYAEAGTVVLDAVDFPDADIVGAMALDELDGPGFPDVPDGRLARYRVGLDDGVVTRHRRYDGGVELPRVPRTRRGRRHRYAYGQATDRRGANGLVKVDCERGRAREWWERSVYVEEPVPVVRPGGDAEDDGVVLATALDTGRDRSYLLVFDAATLDELARVVLPHPEPFGFHGRYFPEL